MLRVLDVFSALPFLLIVILLLSLFGRSLGLAAGRDRRLRVDRPGAGDARRSARLREAPFVLAAHAAGATFRQRLRWHLLPNLLPLAFVYLGLILPQAILVESFLGFLGLSVDEPSASWGTLLAEGSRNSIPRRGRCCSRPASWSRRWPLPVPRRRPARLAGCARGTTSEPAARRLAARCRYSLTRALDALARPARPGDAGGDCLGLVGESGSGKSLTALALLGLLPPGLRGDGPAACRWPRSTLLSRGTPARCVAARWPGCRRIRRPACTPCAAWARS